MYLPRCVDLKGPGSIATRAGKIALPAKVDKKHEDLKGSLKRSARDEFDGGYVKAMVSGHDEAVALFDAASRSKTLPRPLQLYATEMLPMIRNHRDAAHALQSRP